MRRSSEPRSHTDDMQDEDVFTIAGFIVQCSFVAVHMNLAVQRNTSGELGAG